MRGLKRGERVLEHHLHAPPHARAACARSALSMRSPSRRTLPAAIGCSASSAMPSVVLPEPDSPTMPSVSPRLSASVALFTAWNWRLPNQPSRNAKLTPTPSPCTSTGASAGTGCTTRCGPAGQQLAACRRAAGGRRPSAVSPISTSRPRSITPTRCVKRRTRFRSCVMNSSAMPISACSSSSRARICAWMVTSSAVVGSSQISSLGRQASAMAIMARWRWPPRELVRVDVDALARARGCRCAPAARWRARAPRSWRSRLVQLEHLADLVAHRVQRVQRRHRLLEDHADARAADAAHLALALGAQVLAVEADRAGGDGARRPGAAPTAR